jgi:alkylation response protein AidB-like acyl-CoA dehydrogenase
VAHAEALFGARTGAKLRVIADQIRSLQAEAQKILQEARDKRALTRAQCGFQRIPGHTDHLYRKADESTLFSMLAPDDWGGQPPYDFLGSYRLEGDYSWSPAGSAASDTKSSDLVAALLKIGGLSPPGE